MLTAYSNSKPNEFYNACLLPLPLIFSEHDYPFPVHFLPMFTRPLPVYPKSPQFTPNPPSLPPPRLHHTLPVYRGWCKRGSKKRGGGLNGVGVGMSMSRLTCGREECGCKCGGVYTGKTTEDDKGRKKTHKNEK